MTRYIAFLRAINVGGRTVKMEDLRQMLALPGFKNIATYIQSGNVAFDIASIEKEAVINKIETRLNKTLGFEVKAFIKTIAEIEQIIKKNPFPTHGEDMALHISFLSGEPATDALQALLLIQNEQEQFCIIDTEAYILVKKGAYGETKFSNTFLEKKLKLHATTRNWATLNKMLTM